MSDDHDDFLQILTIMNAKSIDMMSAGRGTKPGISSAEVSAALAGGDAVGATIIKRKYQGLSDQDEGFNVLYGRLVRHLDGLEWENVNKALATGQIRRILDIVLDDLCIDYHCRVCHGTGKVAEAKGSVVMRTCRSCKGERFKTRLDKTRAKLLRVSPAEYSKIWRTRHGQVSDFLTDTVCLANHEANARQQFWRNLR
jgi:hypothetical protein